jgi:hypothetical protein
MVGGALRQGAGRPGCMRVAFVAGGRLAGIDMSQRRGEMTVASGRFSPRGFHGVLRALLSARLRRRVGRLRGRRGRRGRRRVARY